MRHRYLNENTLYFRGDELQALTVRIAYLELTKLGKARPGTSDLGLVIGGVRVPDPWQTRQHAGRAASPK